MYFNLLCSTPCTSQKYSYIVYSLYLNLALPYCTLLYHTLPSLTACTSSYYLHLTIPHLSVPYFTIPYHSLQPVPHHTTCTLTIPHLSVPYFTIPYHPLQPVPHHTTCTLPYLIFLYLTVPYTLPSLTACTSSYYLHLTIPHLSVPYCTIHLTIPYSLYLIILLTSTLPYLIFLYLTLPYLTIPYSLYLIIQLAPNHTSSFCTLLYMYLTLPLLPCFFLPYLYLIVPHLYLGHKATHQLNQIKLDISWHVVVVQMQNNISFLIICQVAQ